eukprot:Phypoly_transcript_15920.p1 GENE.Phypoly_transcript_15920~~Phypoly_transcript_15920.p1  ORF type:complete len:213 (+),score=27.41 Phypoly_transcript_15920:130-768(+)
MENTKEFQNVITSIRQVELSLTKLEESVKAYENNGMDVKKEIEEFFAKCIDALAVRKDALLKELDSEISNQRNETEDMRKQLKHAKELREKMLETGVFVYSTDRKIAAHVWEGVANLLVPQFPKIQIKLDMSNFFIELIKSHGKVLVVKSNSDNPSEPYPKPESPKPQPELPKPDPRQPEPPKPEPPKVIQLPPARYYPRRWLRYSCLNINP